MVERLSPAARLWRAWIEPVSSVEGDEPRWQARSLASLLLASALIVLITLPFPIWINPRPLAERPEIFTGILGIIFCYIGYRFSRLGKIRIAIGVMIIYGTASTLVPPVVNGGIEGLHSLYFLVVLVIFANLFISFRGVVLIFCLQAVAVILALPWMPNITFTDALRPLNFNLFAGAVVVLVMFHRSRLEQERARRLAESEQRYKDLISNMRDIIYEQSASGQMLSVNQAIQPILGYTPEEALNLNITDLMHPDDLPKALQFREAVKRGESPPPMTYRLVTKTGEVRWIETHITPRYEDGKLVRMAGITRDITERKATEDALKQSEERYRMITELISDYAFSYRIQPDGSLKDEWITTASLTRVSGYTFEEVRGNLKPLHPDEMEHVQELQRRTIAGETTESEHRILTKSGELRWVRVFRTPIWNEDETQVTGYCGVAQDITQRKAAEDALRHSEERYRIILELISDYAYSLLIKPDGTFTEEWVTHESFTRVTGYTWDEINVSQSIKPIHPDDEPTVREMMRRTLLGESNDSEHRILTKSGELRWIHMYRRPIWQDGRVIRYYGVAQDITERKRAESALKQSEERYRLISEMISDYAYFYRLEPDGRRVREWITGSFTRVTGYAPDEIPGDDVSTLIAPEHHEQLRLDRELVAQGETADSEYRIITKSGESRWLLTRRLPIYDEDLKQVIGYYGVSQDITERKLAEAQKLKLALEQDRSRLVGQFVLAISHDFRTSLATIETSRYLAERVLKNKGDNPVQSKLDTIERAVMHMGRQLENLHMVSSLTDSRPTRCDLNRLLSMLVNEQTGRAEYKQLRLIFSPSEDDARVMVDEEKFRLALQHLLTNAMSHTQPGGQIEIRTFVTPQGMLIEVEDNGRGIEPDDLPHVFDLFYRGDDARNQEWGGVGLGLTIVKMIVESHDGRVSVRSTPGTGSTFSILLPHEWDVVAASD